MAEHVLITNKLHCQFSFTAPSRQSIKKFLLFQTIHEIVLYSSIKTFELAMTASTFEQIKMKKEGFTEWHHKSHLHVDILPPQQLPNHRLVAPHGGVVQWSQTKRVLQTNRRTCRKQTADN